MIDTPKRPLRVTIHTPDTLYDLLARLEIAMEEMATINPRNTPIKNETKERWYHILADLHAYMSQFIPKSS